MSEQAFVAYTPDVEQTQPGEAETLLELDEAFRKIQEHVRQKHGIVQRGTHAKPTGVLKGRMIVEAGLPPELAQGIFSKVGGTYEVVGRTSQGPSEYLSDKASGQRGLAFKILSVEGLRVPGSSETTTQDFVFGVHDTAFTDATASDFLKGFKLAAGRSTWIPPYSLRQRKYVCSTIPASLHACAVVLPFATATSICRNRFTTCSGWYFFPRPIRSPCPMCLSSIGTKQAGHSKTKRPRFGTDQHLSVFADPSLQILRAERWSDARRQSEHPGAAFGQKPTAWKDKDGHWLQSFAIVTTEANEILAWMHPRMPVILHPRDYDRWLDREETERLPLDLLRPSMRKRWKCTQQTSKSEMFGTRVRS